MKYFITCTLGLIFLLTLTSQANAQTLSKATGNWSGILDLPGMELEVIFKISFLSKTQLATVMDVPAQAAKDIPVAHTSVTNDSMILKVEMVGGSFSGEFVNDSTVEGKWQQSGSEFPLVLSKTDKVTELKRPQTPQKPFRYLSQEVEYTNPKSGLKLAGTLTFPPAAKNCPAVILISGSGEQDRDETVFEHKPFWVIADYLTRNGIAVLRVDDRGVGGSEGDINAATSADFAGDVLAGIDFLKKRKEIDKSKIGLIGHSEGGMIAPMVANQSKDVAFLILLAAPGISGEQLLYEQGELLNKAAGMSDDQIAQNKKLQSAIFDILLHEKDSTKLLDRLQRTYTNGLYPMMNGEQKNAVDAAISAINTPWFNHFLTYDPHPALTQVKCPVLALNGEKDLQVPSKTNLAAIEKALTEGGNKKFTTMELAGLNHLFQTCETGGIVEYAQIEETISPEVLQLIKKWILENE